MSQHYYSLRLKGNFANKSTGDLIKNASTPLTIGESADCDIQFDSDGKYAPEYFATILPNDDGKSWRIIKRSPHVDVNIVGHGGWEYVCNLTDGDIITFGNHQNELRFHTHYDENFNGSLSTTPRPQRHWFYIAIFIAILGIFIASNYVLRNNNQQALNLDDVKNNLQSSIYMIKVDSVEHLENDNGRITTLSTIKPQSETIYGTAFLTKDSLLVTARHCVEYWLGEPISLDTRINNLDDDDIVRIASLIETFNQDHADTTIKQQLKVYCSVVPHDSPNSAPIFTFTSEDDSVYFDTSRDGIVTLDDFVNRYYWRTITPYFNRRDMELGDWLVVKVPQQGAFELADTTIINQMHPNEALAFLGFMENETGIGGFEVESGNLKLWDKATAGEVNLSHSGNISHGYSGGPVIMQQDGKYYVIGIVSKVDDRNQNLKRSVPIQVINLSKHESQTN